MSLIHHTTLAPSKPELLAAWLPAQPWYRGDGEPALTKAGGFRLDDPANQVGMEFVLVSDGPRVYHVPMTYRAEPLAGAEGALVGTIEHGVLGTRWCYDGPHDPVLVAALVALFNGETEAQAQSVSHTPDPTVTAHRDDPARTVAGPANVIANSAEGTDVRLTGGLTLRVRREITEPVPAHRGAVTAGDRGPVVLLLGP